MRDYDDQRTRRVSEFWTSLSAQKLPESPYSSQPEESLQAQTHGILWHREFGLRRMRRWGVQRLFIVGVASFVALLGMLQVMSSVGETIAAFYPDEVDWLLEHIYQLDPSDERASQWPKDEMAGINPVACLSHNDEWQRLPLYAAIKAGCMSFEADVWFFDNEIYVGHSPGELTPERTLRSVYLEPLLELVRNSNSKSFNESVPGHETIGLHGVFSADPTQSLVFLIDFKTATNGLFSLLSSQLEPLRNANYLTHYNGTSLVSGPITIVASGRASFKKVVANETYRDIFYDAPLDRLDDGSNSKSNGEGLPKDEQPLNTGVHPVEGQYSQSDASVAASAKTRRGASDTKAKLPSIMEGYDASNSYFASTSFRHTVGRVWGSRLTQAQLQRIRSHIQGAHERGLKARYWETPLWPIGLRNHIWHVLVREGVDILGIDDLSGAATIDWHKRNGWLN